MDRTDLQQLSKEQLIELVLRLQRPDKNSRTSSKPPSTDKKEERENSRPGGAKPGHEPHNRRLADNPDDTQIVGKLFQLEMAAGDSTAAAKLLIEQLAAQPDTLGDLNPLISQLLRPTGPNSLRPAQIQKLDVPDYAQAAKLSR